MSRPARTPPGALGAVLPFLRMARRSPSGSSDGELSAAPFSRAARRRRRERPLVGVFGSALLALSSVVDSYAQPPIGRLFSSPEQRAELDRLRNNPGSGEVAEPVVAEPRLESGPEPERGLPALAVTINGVVSRGDGHRVAWVNGVETVAGTTTIEGVRIDTDHGPGGRVRIRLPEGRMSAALKPGQTIDVVNGRVLEAYEHRSTKDAAPISSDRVAISGDGRRRNPHRWWLLHSAGNPTEREPGTWSGSGLRNIGTGAR